MKNITLSNLVQEISHYCICESIKNKKIQYTNQHSVPKIFNPNVTTPLTFRDQLHVHIFAKLISAPTAKNLKIKKHHMFKNLLKTRGNEFDSC